MNFYKMSTKSYFKSKMWNSGIPINYKRSVSTRTVTSPTAREPSVLTDLDRKMFFAEYPKIITTICNLYTIPEIPDIQDWMKKLFNYYISGGHKSRGMMIATAYKIMETPENYNEAAMRDAFILGWCIEMIQTAFIIYDDIIDNSSTRRGQVCWHLLPEVGRSAVNDAGFFNAAVYSYLKYKFGDRPYYADILNKFHEFTSDLVLSIRLEGFTLHNYSQFTTQRYNLISRIKMAYYTFGLPLEISFMLLSNKTAASILESSPDIIRDMGILTTTQNDYTDCYEDEAITGKAGNDIQEGKCTWLAVEALKRCSDEQRNLFENNYGRAELSNVAQIKNLYQQLRMQDVCREHIQTSYKDIVRRVEAIGADSPSLSKAMRGLLDIMYYYPNVKNTLK